MENERQAVKQQIDAVTKRAIDDVTIKIVYDNNPYATGLENAWGFSALIIGAEKKVLFDTGGDGQLLLSNMQKLAITPDDIDVVALSHMHGDHTGGLDSLLERNSKVGIYMPISFPKKLKQIARQHRAKIVEVKEPLEICENVYSTGQIGKLIKEQSLVIRTRAGLIIMTGCAHPGILKMVRAARGSAQSDILLVLGGFHLEWATTGKIEKIISVFKQWHVQYVGPCHCSGHKAKTLFEKSYGQKCLNIGVGRVITVGDLLQVQDA